MLPYLFVQFWFWGEFEMALWKKELNFMGNPSYEIVKVFTPCNYRPHPKDGKVLFSQVSVCLHLRGVPQSQVTGPRSFPGGTPT